MRSKWFFWIVVLIAVGLYASMVFWSIPKIIHDASGLEPFDLRPFGYSFEEAKIFLVALSEQGTHFYLNVQQRLDMLFPFFEMLAVGWSIILLAPKSWARFSWGLALLAVPGTVFDYLENHAVTKMLKSGAQDVTTEMVETASLFTVLKSIAVSVALTLLLGLIVAAIVRRWRRGR